MSPQPDSTFWNEPVRLEFSHRVIFLRGAFGNGSGIWEHLFAQTPMRKGLLVIDQGLQEAQPGILESACATLGAHIDLDSASVTLPGGESAKNNPAVLHDLMEAIDQAGLCRQSLVVALGGGAVLDVAGFAAATAHRGVPLLRIPSTTLSQCDSGIGVKNGVNTFSRKNFTGSFTVPWAVVNDFSILDSLDPATRLEGVAEAIKVALIRDAEFFQWLEDRIESIRAFDPGTEEAWIQRCARHHYDHICRGGDPFESLASRPLDFGHWAAHRLEQLSDWRTSHGEAVAMGIAIDTLYSEAAGLIPASDADRVLALLGKFGCGQAPLAETLKRGGPESLLEGLEEFRQHLGGRLTVTLLKGIGNGMDVHEIDSPLMIDSIRRAAGHPALVR